MAIGIQVLAVSLLTITLVLLVGLGNALPILAGSTELQLNILLLAIAKNRQRGLITGAHLPHLVDERILALQVLPAELADDVAFSQAGLSSRTVGMNLNDTDPVIRLLQSNPGVRAIRVQLGLRLRVALPALLVVALPALLIRLRVLLLRVLLLIGLDRVLLLIRLVLLLILLAIRPLVRLTVILLSVRPLVLLVVIRLAVRLLVLRIGERLLTGLQTLSSGVTEVLPADGAARRFLNPTLDGTAETRLDLAAELPTSLTAQPARLRGSESGRQRHHSAETSNRARSRQSCRKLTHYHSHLKFLVEV